MIAVTENATELLLLLFLVVTFAQSSLDKVVDWNGNLDWLKEHFSKTPLKPVVPALFLILTLTELAAGILCAIGFVQIVLGGSEDWAFLGAVVASLALLMLLFGQRLARDYDGARTIAIYFIPAVFLVFLLQ